MTRASCYLLYMNTAMAEACRERASQPPCSETPQYLAAHLYAAEIQGGAVLLDLHSLQYYAIDASSLPALRRHVLGWPCLPDPQTVHEPPDCLESILESLAESGFLSPTPPDRRFSSIGIPPLTACHPIWDIRARPDEVLLMLYRLISAYMRTLAYLRTKRLDALLARLAPPTRTNMPPAPAPSPERILALVTLYAKLRVWFYTAKDHCLLDTLVFVAVLRKYHVPATMTIGVAPKPFSAHAWAQIQGCVLDDSVEHIREFTPILVV